MRRDQKLLYRRVRALPFCLQLQIFRRSHLAAALRRALASAFRLRGTELLLLVETKTREEAGLFRSATCRGCLALLLPCKDVGALMAALRVLSSALLRQPHCSDTDLSLLLNEYENEDLSGTRCVRLLEYINVEIFDFDRVVAVAPDYTVEDFSTYRGWRESILSSYSHGPFLCSFAAEAFVVRWKESFDPKHVVPDYGYMNLLTEFDLSPSWHR